MSKKQRDLLEKAFEIQNNISVPELAKDLIRELTQQLLCVTHQLRKTKEEKDMLQQALCYECAIAVETMNAQ